MEPTAPVLIDSDRLVAALRGAVAWYEWYASTPRPALRAADHEACLAATAPLEPIARLAGPIGDAAHTVLVGGAGYATEQILTALDVLDAIVNPDRTTAAPWRTNPHPNRETAPRGLPRSAATPHWVEPPLPGL